MHASKAWKINICILSFYALNNFGMNKKKCQWKNKTFHIIQMRTAEKIIPFDAFN